MDSKEEWIDKRKIVVVCKYNNPTLVRKEQIKSYVYHEEEHLGNFFKWK